MNTNARPFVNGSTHRPHPVGTRHTTPASTLCELGALIRTRPSLSSPVPEVAARIATETGDTNAAQCAHAAHSHAMALSRGGAA